MPQRLSANFTDTSTGSISSWSWDFGEPSSSTNTSTAQSSSHTYSAAGTYPVTLTVTGPGGTTIKTSSISVSSPISGGTNGGGTTGGGTTESGLVAAYGFDETTGAIAVDASGFGNHGNIQKAVRITRGRFGKALKFDGVSNRVIVSNSQSLALTTGMTLEAWIYPTMKMSGWADVVIKEPAAGGPVFPYPYGLFANVSSNQPATIVYNNNATRVLTNGATQLPAYTWTHLTATYDGQYQRLYINGVAVAIKQQTSTIFTSTGELSIGGNSIWGEYFQGYIDEVRIYNRALTPAEIVKDLATAISKSNPPQFVIGDQNVEPMVLYSPAGVAQAFQITAQKTQMVTNVQVYLDASTTATKLVAGIYSTTTDGHPGSLLVNGTLTGLKAGTWNSVAIPPQYA